MRLIDADSKECWACNHHTNGECDTWCDYGESFLLRNDVAKAPTAYDIEAVVKELEENSYEYTTVSDLGIPSTGRKIYLKDAIEIVRKGCITTIKPVRGEWIHDINNLYGCSICGNRETMPHKKKKNFCSNCGTDMRKEV